MQNRCAELRHSDCCIGKLGWLAGWLAARASPMFSKGHPDGNTIRPDQLGAGRRAVRCIIGQIQKDPNPTNSYQLADQLLLLRFKSQSSLSATQIQACQSCSAARLDLLRIEAPMITGLPRLLAIALLGVSCPNLFCVVPLLSFPSPVSSDMPTLIL